MDPQPAERPRARRRWGAWLLAVAAVLSLAAGGAALSLMGRPLPVPDWLRDRIEARIADVAPELQVNFGAMEFVVNNGWRPRVRLRDVSLADANGTPLLDLADAEVSMAMRPLLRGQVQPKQIVLNGASVRLRRDADGGFSLALGFSGGALRRADSLPALIANWNRVLLREQLAALVSISLDGVTMRYEDARSGRAWTVDGGRLALDREGSELRLAGSFSLLSGRAYASSLELNYATRIGDPAGEFGINVHDVPARDVAAQSPALAWLGALRAPISGALRGSFGADGALGLVNATLNIGAGALQPNMRTRPIPFEGARSYFSFDPAEQALVFDQLSVASDWVTATAEGRADLRGLEQGRLDELVAQVRVTQLSFNPARLYPRAMSVEGATADLRLELDPFRLTVGQMVISDRGNQLRLSGRLDARETGWDVSMDAHMDALGRERMLALWPQRAVPRTRGWLENNLGAGQLSDIDLALRGVPGERVQVYLDLDYADAEVRFLKTLPPITAAAGQLTLVNDRLAVTATRGAIEAPQGGELAIGGTSFIVPDVTVAGGAPAVVRIAAEGSVTSALSLLALPPLNLLKSSRLAPDFAEGRVEATGTLSLPLRRKIAPAEVDYHVAAELSGVGTDALVPGHRLEAERLAMGVTRDALEIAGAGTLGGVPFDGRWTRPMDEPGAASLAEGVMELSPRTLKTFGVGLPEGTLRGQGQGAFRVRLAPDAPPELDLESDLAGIGLSVPQIGWRLGPAQTGRLAISARLGGEEVEVEQLSLSGGGLSAEGQVTARADEGLVRARFDRLSVGGWLDAPVTLTGRGPGAAPAVAVTGGWLDLRTAEFGGGGGGRAPAASPVPIELRLDRLQISDTIALTGFRGRFALLGGLDGTFSGRVNGGTPVAGRAVPQRGRSAFEITSGDAGGVLRDAGLLRQVSGGSMALRLVPGEGEGRFEGALDVTDTRVKDAPAIAALLNAVSVVGLVDELAGQGIQFTDVDARFSLGPSQVTLYEASAVGPSIGLSMDGRYDLPSSRLAMQGVISPVYLLNGIGSVVSRRGEGLLGFNYRLTGPARDPQVSVNPLSVLAPGILRDVFRASPPPVAPAVTSQGRLPGPRRPTAPAPGER